MYACEQHSTQARAGCILADRYSLIHNSENVFELHDITYETLRPQSAVNWYDQLKRHCPFLNKKLRLRHKSLKGTGSQAAVGPICTWARIPAVRRAG